MPRKMTPEQMRAWRLSQPRQSLYEAQRQVSASLSANTAVRNAKSKVESSPAPSVGELPPDARIARKGSADHQDECAGLAHQQTNNQRFGLVLDQDAQHEVAGLFGAGVVWRRVRIEDE